MNPDIINNTLQTFYFMVAVFLLVVAIITYPTLRDRNRKRE